MIEPGSEQLSAPAPSDKLQKLDRVLLFLVRVAKAGAKAADKIYRDIMMMILKR